MIDLCIGAAIKGTLRQAKHYREEASRTTGIAFVVSEDGKEPTRQELEEAQRRLQEEREREKRLWQHLYRPLDGGRQDIICLNYDFSVGEIPQVSEEEMDGLRNRAAGDTVRFWDDNVPFTRCGLLWAAALLEDIPCELQVVSLPASYTRSDGVVVQWRGWGEMEPPLLGHFASAAKVLTGEERAEMARQWRQLHRENAPLRVMENGRVLSAPVDYYDDRIRKEFPQKPAKAVEILIGAMLRQNVPHGDEFIGQRIRAFIQAGELRMVEEDPEMFFRSIVAPL